MKKTNNKLLKDYFHFLLIIFDFKLKEIKSYNYALYAKFMSNSVGVYFFYEFRDTIPNIQFTLLKSNKLEPRPGIYTIRELYKDENFKLQSFYLDEIILFKGGHEYKSYFKEVKTIEDAVRICSKLVDKYARDYVVGKKENYLEIDSWFKNKIMEN